MIPQVSGPWLEWEFCDVPNIEDLSDLKFFGTTSDKKTVAGVKGRIILLVDASTLQIVGGPFEVSQGTIKYITHLEFSPDDKWLFFGRLDKWFSVERGCVENFAQFSENVLVYQWGLFTPDGQYIVVKRSGCFDFQHTCQDKSCVTDLLSLWALLEIDQNRDGEMTCSFTEFYRVERFIASASGEQTKRLFRFLKVHPEVYQSNSCVVPASSGCRFCRRLRELTDSKQESSLSAVRQFIIGLYHQIFQYQVWNLQTGRPILENAFYGSVQLNPFTYVCHVSYPVIKRKEKVECSGLFKALSFANIAVVNAFYTLEWKQKLKDWRYQPERREEFEETLLHMLSLGTFNSFELRMYRNLPTGFETLFDKNMNVYVGVSSEKKWVVVSSLGGVHLMQTGVEEDHLSTINIQMKKHDIPKVERFTFTNDDGYFVYSTRDSVSLYALHLQTGTVLQCVPGINFFYLTKERQVGYLFRSETEERALFLTDFFSPFKFLSSSSVVNTASAKKSIAANYISSVTVESVSSDSLVSLWHITDKGISVLWKSLLVDSILSESSLVGSGHLVLQNCVFSPNGKLIACQRGNQTELHGSVSESGHESRTIFQQDTAFTVLFSFSADSTSLLFCVQGNINNPHFYVWDVQNKIMSASFRAPALLTVECFCLSADKRKLILCRDYEIEIWEYDKIPCRSLARSGVERHYKSVKFRKCTVSLDNELLICCIANIIILFSLRAPDIYSSKRILRGHLGKIEFCQILRVNRYLISYGIDGVLFLWDLIETKAIGFARLTQGMENIASLAVSPEEDRVVCFTSSGRICEIKLCQLEGDLCTKFLTEEAKDKVASIDPKLQLAEEIATTSKSVIPSPEDGEFCSSDSEEDMDWYYLEHDDVEESD